MPLTSPSLKPDVRSLVFQEQVLGAEKYEQERGRQNEQEIFHVSSWIRARRRHWPRFRDAGTMHCCKRSFVYRKRGTVEEEENEKERPFGLDTRDYGKGKSYCSMASTTDEKAGTLTIANSGVGMSKDEVIENLGAIARSGSKAFIEQLKESSSGESGDALGGIIGKFGVSLKYSGMVV